MEAGVSRLGTVQCVFLWCLVLILAPVCCSERDVVSKEYCSSESFKAECGEGQVLLIMRALYGRMHPGRCISNEYSQASKCHSDVSEYFERKCSGRVQCLEVVGSLDSIAQPCPKDFKSYLEVQYRCVSVSYTNDCRHHNHTRLQGDSGYLAMRPYRVPSREALTRCPWKLRMSKGQQIGFTLLRLGLGAHPGIQRHTTQTQICHRKLTILDGNHRKSFKLCARNRRESFIYRSESNEAAVAVQSDDLVDDTEPPMLVFYQADGCADIIPPVGSVVRRTGDTAVVVCNSTQETWYMTCRGTQWIGLPANCSIGVLLAVLIGALLGAAIGACLLTVICFVKKGSRRDARESRGTKPLHPLISQPDKGPSVPEYIHVFNYNQPTSCTDDSYTLHRVAHIDPCDYKSLYVDGGDLRRTSSNHSDATSGKLSAAYYELEASQGDRQ